jgi:Group 4 capsule polysaccharide lipoprotein gfcB, YjbF
VLLEKAPRQGRFFCALHFNAIMFFKTTFLVFLAALLSACQSVNGVNPVLDTGRLLFPSDDFSAHYKPGFEYMLVDHEGHKAAMALGWRQSDVPVVNEYWYSGQREMLHLQNGRLHTVVGMTQEVRAQTPNVPTWQAIVDATANTSGGGALVWSRTRDVQPHYRYGVVEYIISKHIQPTKAQQALVAQPALWFEDQVKSKNQDGKEWLYTELFALVNDRVVYSQQCVGPTLCLRLQPLGVMKP